ncbi:1734_t:CDS:2, partial [Racocetra fulgida]
LSLDEIKDVSTSITYGLTTSTYECMICCEVIRPSNKTWSCGVCWAVFHLQCTQKWAQKSFDNAGSWRCPGCQNNSESIPETYQLRCIEVDHSGGKSCESVCGNLLGCGKHYCKKQCHPDDCTRCEVIEIQKCYCGQTEREATCGEGIAIRCCGGESGKSLQVSDSHEELICDRICRGLRTCGKHQCSVRCCPSANKKSSKSRGSASQEEEYDVNHQCVL